MKIVVDTNILMSALIKDSITRKIITDSGLEFYYPEISLNELKRYERLILDKSRLKTLEYKKLLKNLLDNVMLISTKYFDDKINEASKMMKHIDPDDVVFLACAIALNANIWSDDKDFQKQKKVNIFTTSDFIKKFLKNID